MVLIEILITYPPINNTQNSNRPLAGGSMSRPLFTSKLYDARQKSRSQLVLFEKIDHRTSIRGGHDTKRSNRQTEHSNAFGYLSGPLEQPKSNGFHQSFDDLRGFGQRTSTPIPIPSLSSPFSNQTTVCQRAASRNESIGVRSALFTDYDETDHPFDRHYHQSKDFGRMDDRYASCEKLPQTVQKHYFQSMNNEDRNRIGSSSPPFKRVMKTTLPPPTTSMPMVKFKKQHELSSNNGSYFISPPTPYQHTATTTVSSKPNTSQYLEKQYSLCLSPCQQQEQSLLHLPYRNHKTCQQFQRANQLQNQRPTKNPTRYTSSKTNKSGDISTSPCSHSYPGSKLLYNYPKIIMSAEQQQQQQQQQQSEQSSQNRILIKNGKLVNDDAIFKADIYVEDGIIKDIGPHLIVPGGVKTIDANGFFVLPGGIDPHTHIDSEFMGAKTADDYYSGTRAALAGGTTTIMDFVIAPKGQSLVEAVKKHRTLSDGVACCDYTFHVAIPEYVKGKTDVEMEKLVKDHGISSFKAFMAYKDVLMLNDEDLINVLNQCRRLGALLMVHAENGDIIEYNIRKLKAMGITGPEGHVISRPEEVEAEAVQRITTLANQVNCPLYIVHVNSRMAANVLADARNRGCVVFGEVIAASVGTDGTHCFHKCWQHAAAFIMSPPLRPDRTASEHFINLMASGQLQTMGSDHCAFKNADKALGSDDFSKIPNGINGIEERMMILWEKAVKYGLLDPRQFVAVTSTNAAKIFNLYPRKGRLAKGSDADIVIWGPKPHVISAQNHHFNGDFNVFEGTQISYAPLVVISNGRVVLDENGLHVVQGSGRYLPCAPNSSYLWHSIRERDRVPPLKVNRDGKADEVDSGVVPNNNGMMPPPPLPPQQQQEFQNGSAPSEISPQYPSMSEPFFRDQHPNTPNFYKGTTRSGVRNLQDSSFSLSGAQIDDDKIGKTAIRVQNPPGGRSSGIW